MLNLIIEGSSGDHYMVSFTREGGNLKTSCTCQAGQNRKHCKHRMSLLAGDISNVVGAIPENIGAQISVLLAGSDVEQAIERLRIAEAAVSVAQAEVKRVKKALDRVMHA